MITRDDLNDRDFLQGLYAYATEKAEEVQNELWKRAYLALADAADRLDCFVMRTGSTPPIEGE